MTTSIRALLFDFDGLILDTETPDVQAWRTLCSAYGFEQLGDLWLQNVGLWGNRVFDPIAHLHELTHGSVELETLRKRHNDESNALLEAEPVRAGVKDMLAAARRRGLRLAIASSSPRFWVEGHITRLGLMPYFERLITGDDVPAGRVKPNPDIYLKALEALGVTPAQAIAFEDSPYGVAAAHAAGIFVVGVPTPVSAHLDIGKANLVLKSMSDMTLDELLQRAAAG